MSKPIYQQKADSRTLSSSLADSFRAKLLAAKEWFATSRAQAKQNRELRKERREVMRENAKKPRWPGGIQEKFYMLLDYDPTHSESGEAGSPSIIGALMQWSYRVLWTRRIEIFGWMLIIAIGVVCYTAVSASNEKKSETTIRTEQVQPESFEITSR